MTELTVRGAVLDLLRAQGVTTVFGNPGSTELAFLQHWPNDLRYVLGLQEATVVGMADGYAQGSRTCGFVNLHSAAGVGNAMGNIFTAFRNQTPIVITAGQQSRSIMPRMPFLFAERASEFPRPYVKWSVEPARAEDVPDAIAQAFAIALTPPCGPVFVSVPSDDWARACAPALPRNVRCAAHPDPAALRDMARALAAAAHPAIIAGPEVDCEGGFDALVAAAERLHAPVYVSPYSFRCSFPEDHRLFAGFLPAMPEAVASILKPFDVLAVFGAPVFTFHVEGACSLFEPGGPAIFQVTQDPVAAASAGAGTAIIGSVKAALEALPALLPEPTRTAPAPLARKPAPAGGLTAEWVLSHLSETMPADAIVAEEAPSHRGAIHDHLPIKHPDSFYTMASGGLGYGLPAAVGLAIASPDRRVVAVIGDGSMMYSIQALYTAAQMRLPVVVVVLNNRGYGAMRAFSALMNTPGAPGIDLPGLDFTALAAGHGCAGRRVETADQFARALQDALASDRPWVIDAVVDAAIKGLFHEG